MSLAVCACVSRAEQTARLQAQESEENEQWQGLFSAMLWSDSATEISAHAPGYLTSLIRTNADADLQLQIPFVDLLLSIRGAPD